MNMLFGVVLLVILSFGAFCLWIAIEAVRRGQARTNLGEGYRREQMPTHFWITVSVYICGAIGMFYFAGLLLAEW